MSDVSANAGQDPGLGKPPLPSTHEWAGLRRPAVPADLRGPLLRTAIGGCAGVAGVGAAVAGATSPFPIDDALIAAAGGPAPALQQAGHMIDFFGEPLGVVLLASILAAICLFAARWRLAVLAIGAQGAVGVLVAVLKPLVGREIHGGFLAYPSGHTAGAAAFGMVVGLLLVRGSSRGVRLLVVLGATTAAGFVAAWAQIVLGAHYAGDTLGGYLLALAVIPALALLLDAAVDRLLPGTRPG